VSDRNIDVTFDLTASAQDAAGGGEWQLVVTDAGAGDAGQLTAFVVQITPSVYACEAAGLTNGEALEGNVDNL
jgi:subtilisin-like proprotein convertase family protein